MKCIRKHVGKKAQTIKKTYVKHVLEQRETCTKMTYNHALSWSFSVR